MLQKLNICGLLTLIFLIQTNGLSLPDFESFEELDSFDWDSDSAIDETDYWNLIAELNKPSHEKNVHVESEEKWNEIDNLEWITDDTDGYLTQFSDAHGSMKYYLGKRVRGMC